MSPSQAASTGLRPRPRAPSATARAAASGGVTATGQYIDQQRVDAGIGERRGGRVGKALRRRVADDVDRIAARPLRRQLLVQQCDGFVRQLRQRHPVLRGAVGGHHAGAAAVGEDREPLAGRHAGRRRGCAPRRTAACRCARAPCRSGAARRRTPRRCPPARRCGSRRRASRWRSGPTLSATTGLARAAARSAEMKRRASRMPSTYIRIASVAGIGDQEIEHLAEIDVGGARRATPRC